MLDLFYESGIILKQRNKTMSIALNFKAIGIVKLAMSAEQCYIIGERTAAHHSESLGASYSTLPPLRPRHHWCVPIIARTTAQFTIKIGEKNVSSKEL